MDDSLFAFFQKGVKQVKDKFIYKIISQRVANMLNVNNRTWHVKGRGGGYELPTVS